MFHGGGNRESSPGIIFGAFQADGLVNLVIEYFHMSRRQHSIASLKQRTLLLRGLSKCQKPLSGGRHQRPRRRGSIGLRGRRLPRSWVEFNGGVSFTAMKVEFIVKWARNLKPEINKSSDICSIEYVASLFPHSAAGNTSRRV